MSLLELLYEVHKQANESLENRQLYEWLVELLYRREIDRDVTIDTLHEEIKNLEKSNSDTSKKLKNLLEELEKARSEKGIVHYTMQDISKVDISKI